jgi:hypothetical protein
MRSEEAPATAEGEKGRSSRIARRKARRVVRHLENWAELYEQKEDYHTVLKKIARIKTQWTKKWGADYGKSKGQQYWLIYICICERHRAA